MHHISFTGYVNLLSALALLVILIHSFYSWDKDRKKDHLSLSFQQFIQSQNPTIIASAVEEAIKAFKGNLTLLCEEIIKIVTENPLGRLI